ncbi:hypothetical protein GDO86_003107 [Hymenochirus boettgeri]|uniref:Exonuclease V n=1 Tax=Hymenochirus boettgeri TaxID=247094 RepID=A0A8T2JZL3_9PIPI|nr:hypothetical protein GDO86_003107 [Hymenochirus boettgeri]
MSVTEGSGEVYRPISTTDEEGFSDISDSELLSLQDDNLGNTLHPGEGRTNSHGLCTNEVGTSALNQEEVKKSIGKLKDPGGILQRKRKQVVQKPLDKFRMKYLWVTNLCSQTWCEQQMVYEFEFPGVEKQEKTEAMNAGASIHLARELEVHDVVSVSTQTREDSWAIKFLNVLAMIPVLQSGGHVREFPVFRELDGIFVVGVIDELGYSSKGELELRELKTRTTPSLPRSSQKSSHTFQHLQLRLDQVLGVQVKEHIERAGLTVSTFGDLLELTCLNLAFSELPVIDCIKLEYCYQADGTLLGCETVTFDEKNVMEHLKFCLSYWKGQREVRGVDIEEAWKCSHCSFSNVCEWRTKKSEDALVKCHTKKAK